MRPFLSTSGDCAQHFQELLKHYPPQVSSRNAAVAWACHVHNIVNERLGHAQFDCSKIGDYYDCGCNDEHGGKNATKSDNDGIGNGAGQAGLKETMTTGEKKRKKQPFRIYQER